ncbi:hypothetical protein [Methylobacterium sp. Leaf93]|uniref:hypothetical protein n=1 Tax=Methylobacterium sp. Leaf93 TaxID=1736249 RepID=UPI0006FC52BD|nr:hypothetical protein [Methylobacterium sp. Leaf93]KQP16777.1 hypothetical protein ASF26_02885 [Methylobacterium sp. Leaf93]
MTIAENLVQDRRPPDGAATVRLELCVAHTLRVIAAARTERDDAPVKAARRQLAEIYGVTRLNRRLERGRHSA